MGLELIITYQPSIPYYQPHSNEPAQLRSLHLLVPSNKKFPDLAKTLLSAAFCSYPIPTIINWGNTYNTKGLAAGGAHLGKITGTLDYLNSLPPSAEDDLVLLIDGYDVWFQLHASVLIDRYFSMNAAANKRIRRRISRQAAIDHNIEQKIIISSQKRCWPRDDNHASCYAVPQSTLPKHAYGPQTDQSMHKKGWEYTKYRPRFLNSGVIMGDVAHMRALFERAAQKMDRDKNFGSDQWIFANIFGEQEFQRELLREQYLGSWDRFWRWLGLGEKSILEGNRKHRKPDGWKHGADGAFEFGIGIDYESAHGQTSAFTEHDSAWLHLDDEVAIQKAKEKLHVDTNLKIRLSADIVRSPPPLPPNAEQLGLPANLTWNEVSLHTDLYTSVVPAMVHLNGRLNKYLRRQDWDKTWFYPYARTLLNEYMQREKSPFAVTYDGTGRQIQWAGVDGVEDKSVVRTFGKDGMGEVEWVELLDGYEGEVFRDGIGRWEGPSEVEEEPAPIDVGED
jgi:hypothetical protein